LTDAPPLAHKQAGCACLRQQHLRKGKEEEEEGHCRALPWELLGEMEGCSLKNNGRCAL
jgi:hypothetical protein